MIATGGPVGMPDATNNSLPMISGLQQCFSQLYMHSLEIQALNKHMQVRHLQQQTLQQLQLQQQQQLLLQQQQQQQNQLMLMGGASSALVPYPSNLGGNAGGGAYGVCNWATSAGTGGTGMGNIGGGPVMLGSGGGLNNAVGFTTIGGNPSGLVNLGNTSIGLGTPINNVTPVLAPVGTVNNSGIDAAAATQRGNIFGQANLQSPPSQPPF